jgi:carboxyl-terminal processing protease
MKRARTTAALVLVAIAAFYLGNLVQFQYGGYAPSWVKSILLYQTPKKDIDYRSLEEVFTTIRQKYIKPNPDAQKLTRGAAAGMVSALDDRNSRYLTPEEYQANQSFLEGTFAGIGASVLDKNGQIQIASVIPNTPAQKAGIQAGDNIVEVDGESTKGWTADQAVKKIRGKAGTHVVLVLERAGKNIKLDLQRENITVPSVATHVFGNRVLYVRVFEFGEKTARDFDQALRDNLKGSVNLVLLDLRDNPGGFVDAANDVVSEFVRTGPSTILLDRHGKRDTKNVTGRGVAFDNRLVVLVNENSASASEITAGALKDNNRGRLVGVKTFGKGSVQEDFQVRDGDLHLTIAYWLTPKGHSIEKTGILPDDQVALQHPEDQYQVDRSPNDFSKDSQLTAALAILQSQG